MYHAYALVTLANVVPTKCGGTRKRGNRVERINLAFPQSHVSRRVLRQSTEDAVRSFYAGSLQAIRQVDVFVGARHIESLRPEWVKVCPNCGSPDCGSECILLSWEEIDALNQSDYAASLLDARNNLVSDMLKDFRPIQQIFERESIGDRCADALAQLATSRL